MQLCQCDFASTATSAASDADAIFMSYGFYVATLFLIHTLNVSNVFSSSFSLKKLSPSGLLPR